VPLEIKQKLVPPGLKNNPNRPLKAVNYVTIHTTGNNAASANAKMHADYQFNGSGGREASWHYTVDKGEIWQSFLDAQSCWHAGNVTGNAESIGIEICVNDRAGFPAACKLAAELTAALLKKHGLGLDRVKQHFDWSGKNCPLEIRAGNWGVTWAGFLASVNEFLTDPARPPEEITADALVAAGVSNDKKYWLDVLTGRVAANPAFLKTVFDRLLAKI